MSFQVKYKRTFEKSLADDQVKVSTFVAIKQTEPYEAEIEMELDGDYSNVLDADCIDAVLDTFYRDFFPDKANKERFAEVDKKLSEYLQTLENLKTKHVAELEAEQEKNRLAILEVGEYIAEIMEKVEGSAEHDVHTEDASTTDKTMEGGE